MRRLVPTGPQQHIYPLIFSEILTPFEQLVHAYERIRDEGIVPKSCINHGFTTSLYYADPDGNEVELAMDNQEDVEAMNAWFARGGFDRNFVGVPFDPEENRRAGRGHAEAKQPCRAVFCQAL